MSFKPNNVEHELTTKELLQSILIELKLIKLHQEQITDQVFKMRDAEDDYRRR